MKNKYILVLGLITLLSCSEDFLDRVPLHAPSETTFWQSELDAEIAVNQLYDYLPNARRWWTECYSDNAIMTNAWGERGLGQIKQGSLSPTTGHIQPDYFWSEWKYQDIRRILNYLANLETIEFENEDNARNFEGQARFILAMKYFRMSRYWGDLPLVTEPITLEASRELTRSSQKEVFEFILENVNTAVAFLPDTDDKTGRITQDAALMLKAEVLMWMASMDQYHSRSISDISADQLWRQAANALGTLIQKNRYELSPDLTDVFLSKTNNARSEAILARQYVEEEITNFIDILGLPGGVGLRGGGWASFSAPRNLVDTYECIDGLSIQESPLYDITDPWANRDKRLLEWFLLPGKDVLRVTPAGQEFIFSPFESHPEIGNPEAIGGEGGGGRSGYWCIKHVDLEATHVWGWTNWIIYRYADALLLYAEALNETAPGNDSISWAMDQVRARAGLPSVNPLQGNQVDMRAKIWHERRVEMVSEEKRYFDLLRWKEAENAMNPSAGVLFGINESFDDYLNRPGDWTATKVVAEPIMFDASRGYLWPVPQGVIDKNPKISQNPGW
ncbi:RagB/SusD family nutrient uptake outer membrane protein [Fulvivirgaceae bacterium BMA10]|uniref:RagB/SusD family nutrient uptake outer membrane protein n=1 Tax=Splendidivirga corallicola TaxID=3051826 RepID=A0ABT8KN90_9BACT|nr:RagB/SusD family nutrient uptake outer membrane protein [Fulvivirgaceae bacterium BMA10]